MNRVSINIKWDNTNSVLNSFTYEVAISFILQMKSVVHFTFDEIEAWKGFFSKII